MNSEIAEIISRLKWEKYIRFACDSLERVEPLERAITLLEKYGVSQYKIFIYFLVKDVDEAMERPRFVTSA